MNLVSDQTLCNIKDEVDYAQYIDRDDLVIEIAGKVVPITIDEEGKFSFSVLKDEGFSAEAIEVIDMSEDGKGSENRSNKPEKKKKAEPEDGEVPEAEIDDGDSEDCAVPHEICLPSDKLNEFGGTFHARTQKI